jgi:hypothetical protein
MYAYSIYMYLLIYTYLHKYVYIYIRGRPNLTVSNLNEHLLKHFKFSCLVSTRLTTLIMRRSMILNDDGAGLPTLQPSDSFF